ncbi:E3 ubiquitin-protein ligase TRIM38 [Galemys pyrenaicus]|uniref:E3 ubiquitin-protein ligase TRIM38 n=1 Tax=Galemys pyrenaicus TaxID=202257 RepID=A0A8J6DGX1_GALPY|nr:E3 ubiquitin-protein ligase TRIM38 [Galemys pyrenaicus]
MGKNDNARPLVATTGNAGTTEKKGPAKDPSAQSAELPANPHTLFILIQDFKTCGGIKIQVLCISITVENSVNILSDNIGDFQKAMASAPPTKKMMEEATCSVCLQLMREPVSIDCGHIFCRLCIESILENLQVTSLPSRSQCPLCRTPFQRESFRPSKQLQNLIETIKEMERERLCEEHREQLHLFCEDDGQLICWRCERSSQHRGHNTAPVEDVCPGYKYKWHSKNIKSLKKPRGLQDAITLCLEPGRACPSPPTATTAISTKGGRIPADRDGDSQDLGRSGESLTLSVDFYCSKHYADAGGFVSSVKMRQSPKVKPSPFASRGNSGVKRHASHWEQMPRTEKGELQTGRPFALCLWT